MEFVDGPCASVCVQEKTPLDALIVAFVGAPGSRLNVRLSPFGSVALFVNTSATPSFTVSSEMVDSTGGLFVAPTEVIVRIPPPFVALWPSGLVTVTARAPAAAPDAIVRCSVRLVGLLYVIEFTVTPPPLIA